MLALLTTREIGQVPSDHQLYSNAAPNWFVGHYTIPLHRRCTRLAHAAAYALDPKRQPDAVLRILHSTTIITLTLCTPKSP